jgi:hypothetical protein
MFKLWRSRQLDIHSATTQVYGILPLCPNEVLKRMLTSVRSVRKWEGPHMMDVEVDNIVRYNAIATMHELSATFS